MGIKELKGTEYSKYSIQFGIEKIKNLAFALMIATGNQEQADSHSNILDGIQCENDEEGPVSPIGFPVVKYYPDHNMPDDQPGNDGPNQTNSRKVGNIFGSFNTSFRERANGNDAFAPLFDMVCKITSTKGSLLEACMDNRYLDGILDGLCNTFPNLNKQDAAAILAGENNKGPLKHLKNLYTAVGELVDLDYQKQADKKNGWPGKSYHNYVEKLKTAQNKALNAYRQLFTVENPEAYSEAFAGDGNLTTLLGEGSNIRLAMASLNASNKALNAGFSPEDAEIFGIFAEIEVGIKKSKKDYEQFKQQNNEVNPEYDEYIANAEKDYLAIKNKIGAFEPGFDKAKIMGEICQFAEKYKTDDADVEKHARFGYLGDILKKREKNYQHVKSLAELSFYSDLDKKMELSTHGVYRGTKEYNDIRTNVARLGQLVGPDGRGFVNEQQKEQYKKTKEALLKYIVRKEAEIAGKSNPNKNSVMRLNTMKEVFKSLVSRFEPEYFANKRAYKRLGEYIKGAVEMNREKKTRQVYEKLNALNTVIDKHIGRKTSLSLEEMRTLSEAYKETITAVDKALKNKKDNAGLSKLAKKLGKDFKTINLYIKNNKPAKMHDIYEKSRAEIIEVDDLSVFDKMGAASSERIKIDTEEVKGFFTAERSVQDFNPKEEAKRIAEKYDLPENFMEQNHAQRLFSILKTSTKVKDALFNGFEPAVMTGKTNKDCRAKFRKIFVDDILAELHVDKVGDIPANKHYIYTETMNCFDSLFGEPRNNMTTDEVKKLYGFCEFAAEYVKKDNLSSIREELVKDPEESTDRRNSAMSDIADLFGMDNLLVHTKNCRIKDKKTGKVIKGILMDEAKGIDPANYKNLADAEKAFFDPKTRTSATDNLLLKKSIADLQILDFVCGNMDRHGKNFFYKLDENGKICGLLGIDNDTSFGLLKNAFKHMSGIAPENMMVITKSTWNRIKDMSPETMRGILYGFRLSKEVVDNSVKRFEELKAKITEDQAEYERRGCIKGELIEGRIKVVDDEELDGLEFSSLARGEMNASQGSKKKNLFTRVGDAINGNVFLEYSHDAYLANNKNIGKAKTARMVLAVISGYEFGFAEGDNEFSEIVRGLGKKCTEYSKGINSMIDGKNTLYRDAMQNSVKLLADKCKAYLEAHRFDPSLSENEKKKIDIVKKIQENATILDDCVKKDIELERVLPNFTRNKNDDRARECTIRSGNDTFLESGKAYKLQKKSMLKKLKQFHTTHKKLRPSYLEKQRDILRERIIATAYDFSDPDSELSKLNDAQYNKAKKEMVVDMLMLKTIEMNLAKNKNGEIKYCGLDVTKESTIKNTRRELLNSGEIDALCEELRFDQQTKPLRDFSNKLMGEKIKTATFFDNVIARTDATLAKGISLKPGVNNANHL